jgi:(S)-sulfolactate dehydrogenase
MKDGVRIINCARGGLVDEKALYEALKSGKVAGAALDVFETEPLTRDAALLFDVASNLILTPHIAGVTVESNARVSAITADNVRRVLTRSSA